MADERRGTRRRLRVVAVGLVAAAAAAVAVVVVDPFGDEVADLPTLGATPAPDAGDVRELTVDEPSPGPPQLAFQATGLAGGGFQNAVAFAPDGAVVLVGGDNAGLHRSTDAGLTWVPVGAGLPEWAAKVAGIAFDPDDPNVVVAAGGFAGRTGGVLRSEDGGRTWTVASEDVRFSGANTPDVDGLPRTHPRATGDVLLWHRDVLFAATFDAGVHRSTDGGRTWELLGVVGPWLRGLAVDDDGRLLVATRGEGLWAITDPAGSVASARVPGGPDVVEEVAVADGVVLVAAAEDGVWQLTDGEWRQVHAPDAIVTTVEVAADGRWWAGTHRPRGDAGGVLTSPDGIAWVDATSGDAVDAVVAGTRLPWWLEAAQPSFLPGRNGWTAAQVAVDPTDPTTVLVAGRAGVWRSADGGATWQAAVAGLGATAHDQTAVAAGGRIATANTDHRLLVSDDGLRTVTAVEPGATKGTAVAADPTGPPGTLLVATGERDANVDGELFRVAPDGGITLLGLGDAVDRRRVVAVASGRDRDDRPVVLAAVEEGGLWRLRDDVWSRAPTEAFRGPQDTPDGQLVWPPGGTTVHALDRGSGLWASTDAGTTWSLRWTGAIPSARTDPAGFVAVANDGTVWLATDTELLRLVGEDVSAVDLGAARRPGPVAVLEDGGALVVTRDGLDEPAALLHVCGDEVTPIATGERFRGGVVDATDLDVDAQGHLVVTTTTNGLLRSASPVADLVPCAVTPAT